jgi:uncharacterized protein YdhG (YjbR/CyaY superfamily)
MTTVDSYLSAVPEPERQALEHIRSAVVRLVPGVEQLISYGMPGFKYKGKYLLGYARFRDHLSLFPTSEPIELLEHKLAAFKLFRGTIQFTLDSPIPDPLLEEIIQIRVNNMDKG